MMFNLSFCFPIQLLLYSTPWLYVLFVISLCQFVSFIVFCVDLLCCWCDCVSVCVFVTVCLGVCVCVLQSPGMKTLIFGILQTSTKNRDARNGSGMRHASFCQLACCLNAPPQLWCDHHMLHVSGLFRIVRVGVASRLDSHVWTRSLLRVTAPRLEYLAKVSFETSRALLCSRLLCSLAFSPMHLLIAKCWILIWHGLVLIASCSKAVSGSALIFSSVFFVFFEPAL